jgi:glycosyltransferase involved in cell wall biosynthesis
MKTFSIIIPIYNISNINTLNYFEKLLQTISDNLKNQIILKSFSMLILVNDKPKDKCQEIVQSLLDKYNIDKVLFLNNEENYGQAYSRNYGASLVSSDYLHFIDQDDFISDNFYSSFFSAIEDSPVDIFLSKTHFFFSEDESDFIPYRKRTFNYFRAAARIKDLKYMLCNNIAFSPGQYLISRELFCAVGGFSNLKHRGSDDWGIWVRLFLSFPDATIIFSSSSIFYYRIHKEQNIKRLNMIESIKEQIEILDKLYKHSIVLKLLKFLKQNRIGRLIQVFLYLFIFYRRLYK